ncbi:hypothetical protein [Alkalihalobacillus sp. 1P02AB]|uniref:hypothetical protein n=1 Tax=Alkalihalobacillus sp. 1P02AB TaxID=3132260 RepID=UPI0039A7677A
MTIRIENIHLSKIKTINHPHISKEYIKRMQKTFTELSEYDLLLAVEKEQKGDLFLLVGGVDRHFFMKHYTDMTEAPCIIEERSRSVGKRHLKLLRRLFNRGDIGKENKQTLLELLQEANVRITEIVKITGFTASKIRNEYKIHENVDSNLITQYTSIKAANWISHLNLEKEVEVFLFERAGLPSGNRYRLTYESMKLINLYFKADRERFDYLTKSEQKKVLNQAINFKGLVVSGLKTIVDDMYKEY